MQPVVTDYQDDLISIAWVSASSTGVAVKYNIYYSVFNPFADITVPAVELLATNISGTTFTTTNIIPNRYYQFAVAAYNDFGIQIPFILFMQNFNFF